MIEQYPKEPIELSCDHEWVLINDQKGEGAWLQTFDYYECALCGLQNDVPNTNLDIDDII